MEEWGREVWVRGRSALAGALGTLRCPLQQQGAAQQRQQPQPRWPQQRESEAGSAAQPRAQGRRRPPEPSGAERAARPPPLLPRRCHHSNKELAELRALAARARLEGSAPFPGAGLQPQEARVESGEGERAEDGPEEKAPQHQG